MTEAPHTPPPDALPATGHATLGGVAMVFLKLGCTAFGGCRSHCHDAPGNGTPPLVGDRSGVFGSRWRREPDSRTQFHIGVAILFLRGAPALPLLLGGGLLVLVASQALTRRAALPMAIIGPVAALPGAIAVGGTAVSLTPLGLTFLKIGTIYTCGCRSRRRGQPVAVGSTMAFPLPG